MFVAFRRILISGWQNFQRNLWIVFASIGIMAITLFIFSSLLTFDFLTREVVSIIKDKIDLSIYFVSDVDESEILRVRDILEQLPEVSRVQYISRDQAYQEFKDRHQGNETITRALEELGGNPLQASVNVKADNSEDYTAVFNFLETAPFKDSISKVNFTENKLVIERLNKIAKGVQRGGLAVILVFASLAAAVAYNSVRVAIYSFREEINIMKLVGASKWFIRGPFFIMGILISLIASVGVFFVLWGLIWFIAPRLASFLPEISLAGFFASQWLKIFLVQTLLGVGIMSVSTYIAVNKYLKEQ